MPLLRYARQLPQTAQEELRFRAVSMVDSGLTQTHVAELLGVSRMAVGMWCRKAESQGTDALKKGKRGNPTGPRLQGTQAATICDIIRDHRPEQMKLPFFLWTREAIQRLIEDKCGITLAIRTIGDYMARWGFTVQKPVVRVYERSEPAVQRWLTVDYPAIVARAKKEDAGLW